MNGAAWLMAGWMVLAQEGPHAGHAAPPAPSRAGQDTPRTETSTPVEVALSPDEIRAVGLRVEMPRLEEFARTIRAVAVVTVDERKVAHIHTRFSGYIEKLHANYIGQKVKKGDPLVEIFSPEVLAAQSEYVNALHQVDEARKRGASEAEIKSRQALARAARQRLTLWDLAPSFLDSLARTRTPKRTVTLHSPLSGTITVKDAVQGLYVGPDVHLFEVADLTRVWVVADVYTHELDDIRVGSPVRVEVDGGGGVRTGELEFISPTVQPATRTVSVRLTLDNADGALKPGAYGTLSIEAGGRAGLAIPDQAVLLTGQRALVFVQTGEGRFQAREVQLGRRVPGLVEVKSGLRANEPVVVAAQFVLDAESQLRTSATGHAGHGGH
ncbi:MAG: efflux RND transporter periplasmic adaptor subunit [Myxococcota bacterium]